MRLSDTVNLMNSTDWKDRLVAEYVQLSIRLSKLEDVIDNKSDISYTFDDRTRAILMKQLDAMRPYKICIEKRADIAGVSLNPYTE